MNDTDVSGRNSTKLRGIEEYYEVWKARFASDINKVFTQLTAWYPANFHALQETLLTHFEQENTNMWGEVWSKGQTETERQQEAGQAQRDCQDYCDRMASLLRGLSAQAAHKYPFPAKRFDDVALDAREILQDYKAALGNGITEEQLKVETALVE